MLFDRLTGARVYMIRIYTIRQQYQLCWYCCLTSCLEIAKYLELLFNYIVTSLFSRLKGGLRIICLYSFTSTSPCEALMKCLTVCRGTLHWRSAPKYAHFIVICLCLLAHTNGVSKLGKQSRLRITFPFALPLENG